MPPYITIILFLQLLKLFSLMHLKKIVFFVLITNFCWAQTTIARTAAATVTVNSYMSLDLTATGTIDFNFAQNLELENGIELKNKFSVGIITNKNWILNVSSLTSNFLAIGPDASAAMPPSILGIKKSSSTAYVPVSNVQGTLTLGSRGDLTLSGNQFQMDIKATPGYTYNEGSYSLVLLFTLSAQ